MRRRSRAGGEPAKAHRRKTVARKSRVTSKTAHPSSSSAARKETKVARLARELKEARDRQRATAEVLSAISRSKFRTTGDSAERCGHRVAALSRGRVCDLPIGRRSLPLCGRLQPR